MGAYINPKNMSKEQWLSENATEVPFVDWDLPEGYLPVVLVDNGPFTAAGIAYCKEELGTFKHPEDMRPKRFFIAPIHKLHEVSRELKGYMELAKRKGA
jgi:hypothetical protein